MQVRTAGEYTYTDIKTDQERVEYIKDRNGITIKINGEIIVSPETELDK